MNLIGNLDLIFLFFFLGMFAAWIRSDLHMPEPISKFLSIFLLLSLGLKGGHEVRAAADLSALLPVFTLGLASCLVIPILVFFGFRRRLGSADAAALGGCYGSVSAVTFIAAQGYLDNLGIKFSPFMVAVMALMEIPAIIVALYLAKKYVSGERPAGTESRDTSIFAAKSVVLLLGGFIIGLLMNEPSWLSIKPVVKDSFKGFLVFFLLDLGLVAQRQLRAAWQHKGKALLIALLLPLIFGSLASLVAHLMGIEQGDQILISVLVGSASYIAAPAAIRASIPNANQSLYVALPMALTFPMNLLIGIPIYYQISQLLTF